MPPGFLFTMTREHGASILLWIHLHSNETPVKTTKEAQCSFTLPGHTGARQGPFQPQQVHLEKEWLPLGVGEAGGLKP